jgi:gas vesicle protein
MATGVGGTMAADSAEDAVRQLFGEQPLSSAELTKDLLIGGVAGGATGGLLGKLGDLSAEQLSKVLTNAADSVSTTNPQQFVDLMTLAKQLEGTTGKVSVGVLSSVASQLVTTQQIDAEGVVSDQLEELLERAADG